jgi:hypothetical protein
VRRRELFGWALAGAVATPGVAAAAGRPLVLAPVLGLAELAVFVSEDLLAGGKLGAAATAVARRILVHEQTHVQVLRPAVAKIGESAPPPPTTVAQADRRLGKLNASGRLAQVRSEGDALRLLYDVESMVIGRCWEALYTLTDPALIRTTAEIMASDAQHASAIGGLLHPGKWDRVVPVGSVEGKH